MFTGSSTKGICTYISVMSPISMSQLHYIAIYISVCSCIINVSAVQSVVLHRVHTCMRQKAIIIYVLHYIVIPNYILDNSPAFGGKLCEGISREYEICNTDVCMVHFILHSTL